MVSFSYLNLNAEIEMCVSQFFYFIYILISFAITFSIPVGFLPGKGGFPYQVYFYLCLH
jgi:hypothetical protein